MNTMGHLKCISQRDSHPRAWMTLGRVVSAKSNRITCHFGWMPHLEKFSEKSCWAFSSRNRTWRGGRLEEEDDPKQKGFRVGVGLCLGAMHSLSKRKREREREKQNTITTKYKERKERVRMHEMCMNMWCAKIIASWVQPNPNLAAHNFQRLNTHLNAWNIIKMLMECNAWSYRIK